MLDDIMAVMDRAFDPTYGEAWTRTQVAEALALPNTWCLLAGPDGRAPASGTRVVGFAMSRGAAGEEELLLVAVDPAYRRQGIGARLLERFIATARQRDAHQLFLEVREGNQAIHLYARHGFHQVGRRRAYYKSKAGEQFDALTLSRDDGSNN